MRPFLKWTARIVGGLLLVLVLAGATLYVLGGQKVNRALEAPTAALTVPADSASVARGAHLARIFGCYDCHGADLSGQVLVDAPPFGITASNLTPGGVGATYTDTDWDRAVRHGLRPNGHALQIMPASAYHELSDRDFGALLAFLKSLPAVDKELAPTEIRPLGRLLVGAGQIDPAAEVDLTPTRAENPPVGPTAAYGEYLAASCRHCHGADLRGMQPPDPGSPPAPDITAYGRAPVAGLARILRTGTRPDGRQIDPMFMPWTAFRHMTNDEVAAIHAYLVTRSADA